MNALFLLLIVVVAVSATTPQFNEKANDMECAMCEYLVGWIENFASQNNTEVEIEQLIDADFCNKFLPKSYAGTCVAIVDTYLPELIEWVVTKESPEIACTQVGLCASKDEEADEAVIVEGDLECTVCQYIVSYVEEYVAQNKTEQEIEALLEKACGYAPKSYQATCDALVQAYLGQIIAALENKEDPATICDQLTLCKSEGVDEIEAPVEGDLECTICEYLVSYIEEYVAQNKTEQEIMTELEKVCKLIPKSYQATCDALVQAYVPQIIAELANGEPPSTVCTKVGLCTSDSIVIQIEAPVEGDLECTVCEYVVSYVEEYLSQNKTEQEIEALLEKVCGYAPKSYQATCDALVQAYLPQIISELTNGEPASTVCSKIGLCTSSDFLVAALKELYGADWQCQACSIGLSVVDDLLQNAMLQNDLTTLVEKLCNYAPDADKDMCKGLVSQYLPVALNLLSEKVSPALCKDLC